MTSVLGERSFISKPRNLDRKSKGQLSGIMHCAGASSRACAREGRFFVLPSGGVSAIQSYISPSKCFWLLD